MQKTKNQPNYFRPLGKVNQFFNHLSNQADFKKLLTAVGSASLTTDEITELMAAQYQPNYSPSSRTDALIKAIDKADKLSTLPEKAFHNLTTHIGKKFKFSDINIKNLQTLEKNGNKDLAKTLYDAFQDKSNIQYMPKKTRELLQPIHNEILKAKMEDYTKTIGTLNVSPSVHTRLHGYQALLIDIEQGKKKPSTADLEKLNLLYNELKSLGKLDAMPNRTQAYLENYQLEQDLKKKAPLNAQKLLEKLKRGEKIGVFQAFYLMTHLKQAQTNLSSDKELHFHKNITAILKDLSQDVRDKAAEIKNLDKSALLESFEKIIEQIRAEQGRASNRRFYVKELGVYLQLTGNFMELRFRNKDFSDQYHEAMRQAIRDSKDKSLDEIADNLQQFKLVSHRGLDFTGKYLETDGSVRYIKDSEVNPTISKVLRVSDDSPYSITILEYNENTDKMRLTSFRHLSQSLVVKGQIISSNHKIGSVMKDDGTNEHSHIEQRIVDFAKVRDAVGANHKEIINDKIINYLNTHIGNKWWERRHGEFKQSELIKAINPMSNIGEKDFVGLFAPSSNIANQIRTHAKKDWDERASRIIKANNATTVENIYDAIHSGTLRDILTLKAMIDVLLRMKLMLETVGEKTDFLNKTIQKAQKTKLDLEDSFEKIFKNMKIKFIEEK